MSVKVVSVSFTSVASSVSIDSPHIYDGQTRVYVTLQRQDVTLKVVFSINAGFKTDGASIPVPFRWFLPSWDKNNILYNLGSTVHDGLYIHKGFGVFTREECDDILRGIWRESGISRFKAGVADRCVQWFAGGDKHWGNDSYGVSDLFEMEF